MVADLRCYNIADLRERARRRLPRGIWEYAERAVELGAVVKLVTKHCEPDL